MKPFKIVVNVALTLALATGFMWAFGHIPFSDSMAAAYARFGGLLGFYGDEALEDLYLYITMAVSLLLAALLVWRANAALSKQTAPRT